MVKDIDQFKQLLKINEDEQQEQSDRFLTDIYNMLKDDTYTEIEKAEIANAVRQFLNSSIIIQQNAISVIEELLSESGGDVH